MDKKLFIPLLLGTNREERRSEHVARLVFSYMQKREDIETQFFDVRDFSIPKSGYGEAMKNQFPEYRDAIIRADGLVIVTPEYNHGYPGVLKFVLDLLLKEYIHKVVGLVGVSFGSWGGTRVIESLVSVVRELGLAVTFTDLHFPNAGNLFDSKGVLVENARERYDKLAAAFLDELVWMATVLRWGRENVSSKHHQL